MNFKQFLIEQEILEVKSKEKITRRTSETSMLEAIDYIRTRCSEILKKYKTGKNRIFRGFDSSKYFVYGDSNSRIRTSKNTENYYTLIMDNTDQWKNYPKRSQSFICSSSEYISDGYGEVYLVFPEDGTKIGMCPKEDMWYSSEAQYDLNYADINDAVKAMAKKFKIDINVSNFNSFKKSIDLLSNKLKHEKITRLHEYSYRFEKIYSTIMENYNGDVFNALEDMFSPKNFTLTDTKTLNLKHERECWFSGKAIFVTYDRSMWLGPKKNNNYYSTIEDDADDKKHEMTAEQLIKLL